MAEENCWEVLSCPSERKESCPAFPDNGRTCFSVAKTLCGGVVQGSYEQKIVNCRKCQVYERLMTSV